MQFDVWQFIVIFYLKIWLYVLQVKEPLTLNRGQYLQDNILLQGLVSTHLGGFSLLVLSIYLLLLYVLPVTLCSAQLFSDTVLG